MNFENQNQPEQEKSKEQLLEEFKDSLKEYNIEAKCNLEQAEQEKISMEWKVGEGPLNVGYDKKTRDLSFGLDQNDPKSEHPKKTHDHKAGTMLNLNTEIKGVVMEKSNDKVKITLDKNHPAVKFSNLVGVPICLSGRYDEWMTKEQFNINEKTGEMEVEIRWDGESTDECGENIKCKIYMNIPDDKSCDWNSAKREKGATQTLVIDNDNIE